jgi:kynurenine formamidase
MGPLADRQAGVLVDLTHVLRPGLANPRDRPELDLRLDPIKSVSDDGVQVLKISYGDHIGTHLDFPAHLIAGGDGSEAIPLDRFRGNAVAISMPRGNNGEIGVDDFESCGVPIGQDDIVLIHTGWEDKIGTAEYSDEHPYITPEAASWLVARGVKMVGIDVSSLECPFALRPPGFRHNTLRVLLEAGVLPLHNVANLTQIVGRTATLYAFPLPIAGADGSGVRAFAVLDELA